MEESPTSPAIRRIDPTLAFFNGLGRFWHRWLTNGFLPVAECHNPVSKGCMQIGYARVSRGNHQDLAAQLAALGAAGCDPVFREEASGGQTDRPEPARAIGALTLGDVLVVWKLDRLSRSLRDLLFTLEAITAAGAGFRSLTEAVDTTTAAGRLMTQTLGAFAEFERAMIRQRTMNGRRMRAAPDDCLAVDRALPPHSVPRSSPRLNQVRDRRPSSPDCFGYRVPRSSACCASIAKAS
jgi:hypothetical protein